MTDTAASGKRSIPKSSIILLCLFIVYLALTFIGAVHKLVYFRRGCRASSMEGSVQTAA